MSAIVTTGDHDAALRGALRTIEVAYVERGRAMESELNSLRAWGQEQQDLAAAANRRVHALESEVSAANARASDSHREKLAMEQRLYDMQREVAMLRSADQRSHELQRENASILSTMAALKSEKQQLELTVRSLQKDLSKLDSFKQSIITSIREDNLHPSARPVTPPREQPYSSGPSSHSQLPASVLGSGSSYRAAASHSPVGGGSAYLSNNSYTLPQSGSAGLRSSAPPPPAAPASGGYTRSTPTSPAARLGGAHAGGLSPGSGLGGGAAAYVDGKDFFRLARSRLSYEQFNHFLANIKSLNDHTQSRDVTLEQARQIFGVANEDLFASFRSLLAHHGLV